LEPTRTSVFFFCGHPARRWCEEGRVSSLRHKSSQCGRRGNLIAARYTEWTGGGAARGRAASRGRHIRDGMATSSLFCVGKKGGFEGERGQWWLAGEKRDEWGCGDGGRIRPSVSLSFHSYAPCRQPISLSERRAWGSQPRRRLRQSLIPASPLKKLALTSALSIFSPLFLSLPSSLRLRPRTPTGTTRCRLGTTR
jgi:hypothetical protein